MVEELSGEELVLVLLAVSEAVVVFVKIRLPGTVRGLFTAPNTGAGLGCINKRKEWWSIVIRLQYISQVYINVLHVALNQDKSIKLSTNIFICMFEKS